jgi:hypothetical protein
MQRCDVLIPSDFPNWLGGGEHRFPGGFVVTDGELIPAAHERQFQQLWVGFDAGEPAGFANAHVLEPSLNVGFAGVVEERRQAKALDEAADFAGGHGLLFEIDEVDLDAALLEEALGGASGGVVLEAEDLDANRGQFRMLPHGGSVPRARSIRGRWAALRYRV